MEANELRIGNKVYNPNHQKVYTVEGFKYSRAPGLERRAYVSTFEHSEHSVLISVLEPIRLNDDWLVNAGAKTIPDRENHWKLGNFTILKKEDGYSLSPFENVWMDVEYVHDLQNLYFYHHHKTDLDLIRLY